MNFLGFLHYNNQLISSPSLNQHFLFIKIDPLHFLLIFMPKNLAFSITKSYCPLHKNSAKPAFLTEYLHNCAYRIQWKNHFFCLDQNFPFSIFIKKLYTLNFSVFEGKFFWFRVKKKGFFLVFLWVEMDGVLKGECE